MSGPHDRNMVRTRAHRLGRAGAWLLAGAGVVVIIVAVLLALPVEQWRTGKRFENTLSTLPEAALPQPAQRIWIDSDPACGVGRRVDADDCLAILYLALHGDIDIVGVSTVFGNASLEVTDGTARELVDVLTRQGTAQLAVHAGASEPRGRKRTTPATEAERALIDALSAGPLTILALGPLTNLAAALVARPGLRHQVERIVAVMGRRPGHVFHPSEGNGTGVLFGHGPIVRDFKSPWIPKRPLP
jgi:Inosine-uridine preferring nucleoside hydrolase